MTAFRFRKMNGLGNDFLVLDGRTGAPRLTPAEIATLADRTTGIGFDQMITVEPSANGADAFMRIDNADGGEVAACGNATRCIGWLLMSESGRDRVTIETRAGLLRAFATGEAERVTVDMGVPKFAWDEIPLAEPFADTRAIELQIGPIDAPILHSPACVNMGNPHAVFFVDDVEAIDLARVGPLLENHPIFPERANISVVHVTSPHSLVQRVWERGAGLTLACGTGACAAAVAAHRTRRTGRTVDVTLPGGTLTIDWRATDDHVTMTGPISNDFTGTIERETLAVDRDAEPATSGRGVAE
jgi:diaminopimelate epimerase